MNLYDFVYLKKNIMKRDIEIPYIPVAKRMPVDINVPYFKFKESDLFKKYSFINEDDYLDSTDNCVVTRNMVYYSTLESSAGSIIKGYLKMSMSMNMSRKSGWLFDPKTYKKKKNHELNIDHINSIDDDSVKTFLNHVFSTIKEQNRIKEEKELHLQELHDQEEKIKVENLALLNNSKTTLFNEIDNDNDGTIDLVQGNDFMKLLTKNQNKIIEFDKEYVQKFIKVSNYLEVKRNNIQSIYSLIQDTTDLDHLRNQVGMLRNQMHTYRLIVFNSLNMINSLIENDLIKFYKIYEGFDKLNMFNSNWENEISQQLKDTNSNLSNLLVTIEKVGEVIVNSIGDLIDINEESNRNLENQLEEIDSSLKLNNLITGIQTYQMYKINKNTNSLN
jgi:hypothetical protein